MFIIIFFVSSYFRVFLRLLFCRQHVSLGRAASSISQGPETTARSKLGTLGHTRFLAMKHGSSHSSDGWSICFAPRRHCHAENFIW